jgi:hypothetical protein
MRDTMDKSLPFFLEKVTGRTYNEKGPETAH